jgi:hypothetical protein
LKTIINDALVSANLVDANAVYGYLPSDFEGKSPVVTVNSAGSLHQKRTRGGDESSLFFTIHIFALYADVNNHNWQEADAESAIDDIEQKISDALRANERHEQWAELSVIEQTITDSVEVGGVEYRREVIQIKARVFSAN